MLYVSIAFAVLCLVAVGVFLAWRTKQANAKSLMAKTVASVFFILMAVVSLFVPGNVQTKILFVFGLVCGLIGDIILDLKVMYPADSQKYLNFGTLMFGIGHLCYLAGVLILVLPYQVTGFWWMTGSALALSFALAAVIQVMSPKLKLDMTGFKWQSILYSAELTFMMLISICLSLVFPIMWILAAGFTLFLASDLVLSMQYFGGKQDSKVLTIVNHVLYYLAQVLIAGFLIFI